MAISKESHYRERILLLPNILTTGNLFFGFYAIISILNGSFRRACFAIIIAMVFDLLDGRVARLTKSSSKFGEEYDSLTDLISFGVAPALLLFIWSGLYTSIPLLQKLGWLTAFFFTACGALRLARYNIQQAKRGFIGLPIPVSAAFISSGILLYDVLGQRWNTDWLSLGVLLVLGMLMVSSIPYKSYKDLEIRERHPFSLLVVVILFVTLMALRPEAVLFFMSLSYIVVGGIWGGFDKSNTASKKSASGNLISIKESIESGK